MQAGQGLTDATAGMRFRVRGASCTCEQSQTQRLTTSPSSLMSSVCDILGSHSGPVKKEPSRRCNQPDYALASRAVPYQRT